MILLPDSSPNAFLRMNNTTGIPLKTMWMKKAVPYSVLGII